MASQEMTPPPKPKRPSLDLSSPGVSENSFSSTGTPPFLRRRTSSRSSNPHTPDRFIPSSTSIQSFRINNPSGRHSEDGRLHGRRRRSASPSPRTGSSRSRSISGNRVGVNSVHTTMYHRSAGGIGMNGLANPVATNPRGPADQGFVVQARMVADDGTLQEETEMHEERLALALGVNLDGRVMNYFEESPNSEKRLSIGPSPVKLQEQSAWKLNSPQIEATAAVLKRRKNEMRKVVSTPFRYVSFCY